MNRSFPPSPSDPGRHLDHGAEVIPTEKSRLDMVGRGNLLFVGRMIILQNGFHAAMAQSLGYHLRIGAVVQEQGGARVPLMPNSA